MAFLNLEEVRTTQPSSKIEERMGRQVRMIQKIKKRCGFTMLEIIIVIIILGTIAGLVLPKFFWFAEGMRKTEGYQILTALLVAQKAYEVENGVYTAVKADLDVEIPTSENFDPPEVADLVTPPAPATDPIATVTRTGEYTLTINDTGKIKCVDGATILCETIGCYDVGGGVNECN